LDESAPAYEMTISEFFRLFLWPLIT